MEAQTLGLTWVDALKLLVPLLGTLVAAFGGIALKHWYERRRERQSLEEFVLRALDEDELSGEVTIPLLRSIVDDLSSNRAFAVQLPSSVALQRAIERLAALDPARSVVYAKYLGTAEAHEQAMSDLRDGAKDYHRSTEPVSRLLKNAIASQVDRAMVECANLEEKALAISQALKVDGLVKPTQEACRALADRVQRGRESLDRHRLPAAIEKGQSEIPLETRIE